MNFNIRPKNFKLKKLQRLDSQTFPQLAFRESGKLQKIQTIASVVASVLEKLHDSDDLFKKQGTTKRKNINGQKLQQSEIIISNKKNRAQVSYQQQYWQRMDPRDKVILVPFHFKITYIDNQDFSEENILNTKLFTSIFEKLQDFLVKVLELVMSISFNQLMEGKMKENQCKDYASKNILLNVHSICKETYQSLKQRNIIDGYQRNVELALVQISDSTLTKAVKNLSPYYPQAPPVGGSARIRQALLAIDRNYNNQLDFLYTQKLVLQKNTQGDYTEYIMKVINRAILVTGEIQEGESRNLTLYQKFKDFTENLIWLVKNQSFSKIMNTILDSNKKNPQILSSTQISSTDKLQIPKKKNQIYNFLKDSNTVNRVQALKFQHQKIAITEETVQKQILAIKQNKQFEMGQKLPNGLKPFSKNEIKDHNFSAKHSSVLRILTKWAQNLEAIFENAEKFVLNRNYPFQTLSGKSIYPQKSMKQKIYNQLVGLKQKKNKILIDLIASNKTFQASFLSKKIEQNQQILEYIKRYTDTRIMASKMNTLVIKFMQKYVSQLINLLIQAGKIELTTQNSKNKSEIQYINLVSFRIGDLMRARMYLNEASCIKLLHTLYMLDEQQSKDSPFFKLVRVKNKLDKKDNNILINFLFKGQLQCELQLFSQKLEGKQKKYYAFSHFLYELSRGSFGILSQCAIIISQHDPIASSPSYYEAQNFLNKQNITDLSATKNHLQGEQKSIFICVKCNKLIMNENKQIFLKQKQNENVCNECFIKHFNKINITPQQSDPKSQKKLTIQNFLTNQQLSQWINELIDNVQIKKITNYGQFSQIKQFCLYFSINPKYNEVDYNILIYEQTQFEWYLIRINDQILKSEQIRDQDMDIKIISEDIGQEREFKQLNYIEVTQNRINISDLILFNKKIPNYINMVNKLYQIEEKARTIIAKNSIMSMLRNKNQTLAFNKNIIKMEIMSELFSAESNINFIEYIFAEQLQLKQIPNWIGQAQKAKLINLSSNSIQNVKLIQSKQQLKQLYLSNNMIEQISCKFLTKLQKLHLKSNRLSSFISDQLPFLTELNLQGNNISQIQLLNFSSLVSLNLSQNQFNSLKTSCLSSNLQKLNISSNQLDSSVLTDLPSNLKQLTVNNNLITELPLGCLPLNLITLNISDNQLTELIIVARPFLSYLNATNNTSLSSVQIKQLPSLSQITMQNCSLSSLDKIQFSPKVSWLHFHNNQISNVSLKNIECLRQLDLTGNNLKKLQLKEVDIRLISLPNNNISSLEGFDFPKTLERIFLKNNALNSASFRNYPNLQILNVQSNSLTSLDLLDLPALRQLALDYNLFTSIQSINIPSSIQSLHCRQNQISQVSLSNMNNLKLIIFDSNPITKITLRQMPKLEEVGLMYTKITSNEDIEVPRTVKKIYLHYNSLESVEYRNMPNLQLVVLQGNNLSHAVFDNLTNLKQFYLNDNKVTTLTLKKLPKLQKLIAPNNLLTSINLSNLPFLKQLSLPTNKLTSIDLGQAPLIQSVSLSFNQIKQIKLKNLPALHNFNIEYNDTESCELQNLPSLVTLNLAQNKINECSLKKLKSLKELKMYGNPMKKLQLVQLKRLTRIQLSETKITNFTINILPSLQSLTIINSQLQTLTCYNTPQLQQLILYQNKLTYVNFHEIDRLKYVNANNNNFTSLSFINQAYLQTLNICQNQIESLTLTSLPKLDSISFRTNKLQRVSFNDLPVVMTIDLTSNNLKQIDLSHITSLPNLIIGSNPITAFQNIKVNKETIKTIDITSTEVEEIYLKDYNTLNSFICAACKKLTKLTIQDCSGLNDITLTQCETLKVLELVRTPNLNHMNLETINLTSIKLQSIGSECMIYVDSAQLQKMIKDILPEVGIYNSSPEANYRSYQQPPY